METARNWLYVQKSRAVHKVGKKEDEIDEMEKEGEKFMALATELRSEVRRYAEIARVKDLKADELEEQIKALEKDLPAPVRSDIENSTVLHRRLRVSTPLMHLNTTTPPTDPSYTNSVPP